MNPIKAPIPQSLEYLSELPFQTSLAYLPKSTADKCEDALLSDDSHHLYAVFDGVGGENGGRKASNVAQNIFGKAAESFRSGRNKMFDVANYINGKLLNEPESGATTISAVRILGFDPLKQEYEIEIFSVGDSRIYLVTKDGTGIRLDQLSTDDSKLTERYEGDEIMRLKREGRMDEIFDENDQLGELTAMEFKERNKITKAIGIKEGLEVRPQNNRRMLIKKGSGILLTSDGVHDQLVSNRRFGSEDIPDDYIIEAIIEKSLWAGDIQNIPKSLVLAARNVIKGGSDLIERLQRCIFNNSIIRRKPDDISALYIHLGEPDSSFNRSVQSILPGQEGRPRSKGQPGRHGSFGVDVQIDQRKKYYNRAGPLVPGNNVARLLEDAMKTGDIGLVKRIRDEYGL